MPFPLKDISLHFHIPVYYGAEIEVEGEASVNVSGLEGQLFEVMAEKGFCELKNLKGSRLSVETEGGDITCDSQLLFEFGTLTTKDKGRISVKKLQGKKFCLQSENGDIDVGATYLIRAEVASKQGQVRLGDIHGKLVLIVVFLFYCDVLINFVLFALFVLENVTQFLSSNKSEGHFTFRPILISKFPLMNPILGYFFIFISLSFMAAFTFREVHYYFPGFLQHPHICYGYLLLLLHMFVFLAVKIYRNNFVFNLAKFCYLCQLMYGN